MRLQGRDASNCSRLLDRQIYSRFTQSDLGAKLSDIFISYSSKDFASIEKLVLALEAQGLSVWWDRHLEGGSRFAKEIEEALGKAKLALVVWSQNSIESPWVLDEASVARDTQILFPISLDGAKPPLGFGQFQTFDLSGWNGQAQSTALDQLVERVGLALSDKAKRATGSSIPSSPPEAHKSWPKQVIAAVLTIVVAVAGFWIWQMANTPSSQDEAVQSLAIMPFDDLSEDGGQSYFSNGLSEELRIVLAQNPQLQVAAQTSSEFFRGQDADARSIADQLSVNYLIEGSVRKSDQLVRVNATLIDGETGFEQWSQSYDRELDDILQIQSEIAARISGDLSSSLVETDAGITRNGGTSNVDAYDAYLRGKALYDLAESIDTDRAALAAFDEAIADDPNYSAAHAYRARALMVISNASGTGDDVASQQQQALEAGARAVELAPDYADAHAALGFVTLNGQLDFAAAGRAYRRAYELGPRDASILDAFATFAFRVGDIDDARTAITQVLKLDPLNPYAFRTAGNIEYVSGEYEAAIDYFRQALQINPDMSGANGAIGDVRYMQGDFDAACARYRAEPSGLTRLRGLAICEARLGNDAASGQAMAQLISDYGTNGLYQQAQVLAQNGDLDAAMEALNSSLTARDSGLVQARNDPLLRELHGREGFQNLLNSLGLD